MSDLDDARTALGGLTVTSVQTTVDDNYVDNDGVSHPGHTLVRLSATDGTASFYGEGVTIADAAAAILDKSGQHARQALAADVERLQAAKASLEADVADLDEAAAQVADLEKAKADLTAQVAALDAARAAKEAAAKADAAPLAVEGDKAVLDEPAAV